MYQRNSNNQRNYTYGRSFAGNDAPQNPTIPVATPLPQQQMMGQFQGQMQPPPPAPVQQPMQQYPQPKSPPPQNRVPQNNYPEEPPSAEEYTSDTEPSFAGQICKIGGKNKFLSFHDELTRAAKPGEHEGDYAAIHGQGGKNHAVRSRIEVRMCDYSKKPSVNVKYNLEPYYLLYLLEIVKAAINGNLAKSSADPAAKNNATACGAITAWIKSGYQPNQADLTSLFKMLSGNASQDDKSGWADRKEKNNPYPSACKMIEGTEHTPVQTFSIQYNPDPSRIYAWTITVSNFIAPIYRDKQKGTSSHNSKQAKETKSVTIPVSTEDLYKTLTHVQHYIDLWEYRAYPMVNTMCGKKEQEAEARRNGT